MKTFSFDNWKYQDKQMNKSYDSDLVSSDARTSPFSVENEGSGESIFHNCEGSQFEIHESYKKHEDDVLSELKGYIYK